MAIFSWLLASRDLYFVRVRHIRSDIPGARAAHAGVGDVPYVDKINDVADGIVMASHASQ